MTKSRINATSENMSIRLYKDEAESLWAKAIQKSQKFETMVSKDRSPYGFNHPHSHYVGVVAEHASWLLFTEIEEMLGIDLNIDAAFKDENRECECDIYVGGKRIEIKGIKYGSWKNYGPCISARQLSKIKRKADIVLWVLLNEKTKEATFVGYNEVNEIESINPILTGPEHSQKIKNYPVISLIKNLTELVFT